MNVRNIVGKVLYYIFSPFVGMPQVLSVYFHNPSPKCFEKSIIWIKGKGYDFIDVSALLNYMQGGGDAIGKHCVVTFDDAWHNNLELLAIVEKYHVPITIFAPVTPLQEGNYWWEYPLKKGGIKLVEAFKTFGNDKFKLELESIKKEISLSRTAMTIDELKMVSKHPLVSIQSHSYTHPILTRLSDESLDYELSASKSFLAKELDKEIFAFSYPNGSLTVREIEMVGKYYRCAFSTIQDSPKIGGDLYTIPRYALTDDLGSNMAKMLGVWNLIKRW